MVLTADLLLAAGSIGADSVSDCVAAFVALPDRGNRGGGCFGIAARNFVSAGTCIARTAGSVK